MSGIAAFFGALSLAAPPAAAEPLVECANSLTGTETASCQLRSAGPSGLRFEKRTLSSSVEIRVHAKEGAVVQTITEPIDGSVGAGIMLLRDIDGTGPEDLLLSLNSLGPHGSPSWAVWRPTGERVRFQRVGGELAGSEFWSAGEGYTAVYTSDNKVQFYRIENGSFQRVASVKQDTLAAADSDTGSTSCSLQNSANLDHYGLTKQTAEQKFCALALPQLRARGLGG